MDKYKLMSFSDKVAALSSVITACSYCGTVMGDCRGHTCGECGEKNALVNLEEAIDIIISLRYTLENEGITRYGRVLEEEQGGAEDDALAMGLPWDLDDENEEY